MGAAYANAGLHFGDTSWDFEGQEIFKRAVNGMSFASKAALERAGVAIDAVDLVVPHQANLRIIDAVGRRIGASPEKTFVTVQRYGNMSSATVPVALVDAVEEGRVRPGATLLTPAFGAGLTWCAQVIRWGDRVTPLGATSVDLPPCNRSAVELVRATIERKRGGGPALDVSFEAG